jgi:hypothetical protein
MTIAFTGLACGRPATLTFNFSATVDFVNNTFAGRYAVIGGEPGEQQAGDGGHVCRRQAPSPAKRATYGECRRIFRNRPMTVLGSVDDIGPATMT